MGDDWGEHMHRTKLRLKKKRVTCFGFCLFKVNFTMVSKSVILFVCLFVSFFLCLFVLLNGIFQYVLRIRIPWDEHHHFSQLFGRFYSSLFHTSNSRKSRVLGVTKAEEILRHFHGVRPQGQRAYVQLSSREVSSYPLKTTFLLVGNI